MPTTINKTLPKEWEDNITYQEGDLVSYAYIIYRCKQTSLNNRPDISKEYWKALDIYIKDSTVMEHGQYSGDEEFWQRDRIYIDSNGWVYVNNENTGINVRGPEGKTSISFDELTPAQLEQIRGPQGIMGPQGPQGVEGPQGPMGEVSLTPEQIQELKGEDGKSTYEIWLENGHSGSEADFLAWVRDGQIFIDKDLDVNSISPVQNNTITKALQQIDNYVKESFTILNTRLTELENRLQYTYQGGVKRFRFGITTEGKYGYFYDNSETLIPFDHTNTDSLISTQADVNNGNFQMSIADSAFIQDNINIDSSQNVLKTMATPLKFDDLFDTKVYLYKNGQFTDEVKNFTLYNMYYNPSDPTDENNLTSFGTEYGEGLILDADGLDNLTAHITIIFAVDEENVNGKYEIGNFINEITLPNVINDKTNVTSYHRDVMPEYGVTNEGFTNIINSNEGFYIASIKYSENDITPYRYKILEIYID